MDSILISGLEKVLFYIVATMLRSHDQPWSKFINALYMNAPNKHETASKTIKNDLVKLFKDNSVKRHNLLTLILLIWICVNFHIRQQVQVWSDKFYFWLSYPLWKRSALNCIENALLVYLQF